MSRTKNIIGSIAGRIVADKLAYLAVLQLARNVFVVSENRITDLGEQVGAVWFREMLKVIGLISAMGPPVLESSQTRNGQIAS